jgi:hypothetical protein
MTLTATLRTQSRDPREVATLNVGFAEKVEYFEQCLNLGLSNDDIGRFFPKESLVEIALHYMNQGRNVTDAYAEFIELENDALV